MDFEIKTGKEKSFMNTMLYGIPGVGKTTLATRKTKSLLCDVENGATRIDCKKVSVNSWEDLLKFIKQVAELKDFDTIIFDSYTRIEKMATDSICQTNGWPNLEKPGFGKGYEILKAYAQRFLDQLAILNKAGKHTITVAHAKTRSVVDPMSENYDRYEPDMHKNSLPLFYSSMDCIFFYRWKTLVKETDKGDRYIATSSGDRELYTREMSSVLAKSRVDLEKTIILNPKEDFFDGVFSK